MLNHSIYEIIPTSILFIYKFILQMEVEMALVVSYVLTTDKLIYGITKNNKRSFLRLIFLKNKEALVSYVHNTHSLIGTSYQVYCVIISSFLYL